MQLYDAMGTHMTRAKIWQTIWLLSIAEIAFIWMPPAKAADSQLWAFCAGTRWVPMDQRLLACKAIIEASDETPANQAIARCDRAIAYNMKGDVELAMADLTEALRLGLGEYQGLHRGAPAQFKRCSCVLQPWDLLSHDEGLRPRDGGL